MSRYDSFPMVEPKEASYIRVVLDEDDGSRGGQIILELPAGLDIDEAAQRWAQCGGQVRDFSGEDVDLVTYGLVDWLLTQEGTRFPESNV